MKLLRYVVIIAAMAMLPGLCAAADASDSSRRLSFDDSSSGLLRLSLYVENVSDVLAPLFTTKVVKQTREAGEVRFARIMEAAVSAGTGELIFFTDNEDSYLSIELPKGDLVLLSQGLVNQEALSRAFGPKAGPVLVENLPGLGAETQKTDVPGVYKIMPRTFLAVEGKRILLATRDVLVEDGRSKLQQGVKAVPMPEKGQQFWLKTSMRMNYDDPKGDDDFETYTQEYAVYKTDEGFRYQGMGNLADLFPELEKTTPLRLDDIPLHGGTRPLLSLLMSPEFFYLLSQTAELSPNLGVLGGSGDLRQDLKGLDKLGAFVGAPEVKLGNIPVPALLLAIGGQEERIRALQDAITRAIPSNWDNASVAGWDMLRTTSQQVMQNPPASAPLFFGRKGTLLAAGLMDQSRLASPGGSQALAQLAPEGEGLSLLFDADMTAIWAMLRASFKPDAPARTSLGLDQMLPSEAVKAIEELLATEFPVRRITTWHSTDLRRDGGVIVMQPGSSADFMDKLLALLSAM